MDNSREFIIQSRYQFLKKVKTTFWITLLITLAASWYQSNWWLLLVVIPFNFFYSTYESARWLKFAKKSTDLDGTTVMKIWNTHKKYIGK